MFNLKKLFKPEKKPLIIAIHGFGKRRIDEFDTLKAALGDDFEIITPVLFDPSKQDDVYWYNWVSRAEEQVIKAKNQKREIFLIGFSMGGVIATYLAGKFAIKRLILIAPAFEYFTMTTMQSAVNNTFFKKDVLDDEQYLSLPSNFTAVFMDVVNNCKDAIFKVTCPVTIFHAMNDEVIPYTTSIKYYKKIAHQDKRLIIYADGQHRLLNDERLKATCLASIRHDLSLETHH